MLGNPQWANEYTHCLYPHFTGRHFHYDGQIGPDCREAPWITIRTGYERREHSRRALKHQERHAAALLLTLLKTRAEQRRSERKWQETPQQRSRKSTVIAERNPNASIVDRRSWNAIETPKKLTWFKAPYLRLTLTLWKSSSNICSSTLI